MRPSSSAARPEAVIHGLTRELAQTASTTRPPGRRTRVISAAARSMSGTSIKPKRQMIPSTDASGRVRAAASSTANRTPSRPSVAARLRATSTNSGATSVEKRDHPFREHGSCTGEHLPLPLPAGRDAAPGRNLLCHDVGYAVTLLKAGMMRSP